MRERDSFATVFTRRVIKRENRVKNGVRPTWIRENPV